MEISVIGTGYVGLVTGVCLSDIGHQVTCIDIDQEKIKTLNNGQSPIFEPGLEELMVKNVQAGRLKFTADFSEGYRQAEVVYIAVGTPQQEDGSANLSYVESAIESLCQHITKDIVVITKSTVPVGTNAKIEKILAGKLAGRIGFEVVSNPEFLREGSAIQDTFESDRIVVGTRTEAAAAIVEDIYKPLGIPVFKTDVESAEMIKYASNAFLATKISFINEIANICEKVGANIEDVSVGMGMDDRIGSKFLKAGIGYGGSCFPKDTKALVQIAGNVKHEFNLLKAVIEVNNKQQLQLLNKAKAHFGDLKGLKIALLGLAFKPNTDDMRESPSIPISEALIREGCQIVGYDPLATPHAKRLLSKEMTYASSVEEAITGADAAFILTEWKQIAKTHPSTYKTLLKQPVVFDGRNIFSIQDMEEAGLLYFSIGRASHATK